MLTSTSASFVRPFGALVIRVAAAVLMREFDEQVLKRAPHRMHGQDFAAGQPYLLNRSPLIERGHGDANEPVVLGAFEHQLVHAAGGDDEALLRFEQFAYRSHAGHASPDHDGDPVANL